MSVCVIYHSYSGNTRKVAEALAAESKAALLEVRDLARYSRISVYFSGGRKAARGELASIEPAEIDVSPYSLFYIGSPVWGRHPTPAVNAAIAALKGCEGKKCVVFATYGGTPGETLNLMATALRARSADVIGSVGIRNGEQGYQEKIRELAGFAMPVSIA